MDSWKLWSNFIPLLPSEDAPSVPMPVPPPPPNVLSPVRSAGMSVVIDAESETLRSKYLSMSIVPYPLSAITYSMMNKFQKMN